MHMLSRLAVLSLLGLALPSAALRVSSPQVSRRRAVMAGAAAMVPAVALTPRSAHADAIADIAARANAQAAQAAKEKEQAAADKKAFKEATDGIANTATTGALVAILGGAVPPLATRTLIFPPASH